MTEAGSWWLKIEEIAALAHWMADHGLDAQDVADMVEKPWKWNEERERMLTEQAETP